MDPLWNRKDSLEGDVLQDHSAEDFMEIYNNKIINLFLFYITFELSVTDHRISLTTISSNVVSLTTINYQFQYLGRFQTPS